MTALLPNPNIVPPPGQRLDDAGLSQVLAAIQENFDALENDRRVSVGTPWKPAAFTPSWKNYESAAFADVEYRKGADGRVFLRGLAQPNAIGQNTLFTLPVGFRPPLEQGFVCAGSYAAAATVFRMDVRANGEVWPEVGFGATSSSYYVFLDTISFYPG